MSGRGGLLAVGGSLLAAAVASACCWLPLLLLATGVSAAGVSARFEAVRPYFLALTAVLLGAGFWLVYFRRPACRPGDGCAAPAPRAQRWSRAPLWVATVAVAALALFPTYAGRLAAGTGAPPPPAAAALETLTLAIDGMTCEGCTPAVRRELLAVARVEAVTVDHAGGAATVFFQPGAAPARDALARAVERAGFALVDGER